MPVCEYSIIITCELNYYRCLITKIQLFSNEYIHLLQFNYLI